MCPKPQCKCAGTRNAMALQTWGSLTCEAESRASCGPVRGYWARGPGPHLSPQAPAHPWEGTGRLPGPARAVPLGPTHRPGTAPLQEGDVEALPHRWTALRPLGPLWSPKSSPGGLAVPQAGLGWEPQTAGPPRSTLTCARRLHLSIKGQVQRRTRGAGQQGAWEPPTGLRRWVTAAPLQGQSP